MSRAKLSGYKLNAMRLRRTVMNRSHPYVIEGSAKVESATFFAKFVTCNKGKGRGNVDLYSVRI